MGRVVEAAVWSLTCASGWVGGCFTVVRLYVVVVTWITRAVRVLVAPALSRHCCWVDVRGLWVLLEYVPVR